MADYIQKLKSVLKGSTAIYVDASNLESSVREMWVNPKDIPNDLKHFESDKLCWRVDYEKLKLFFENICPVIRIAFYTPDFNTESQQRFLWFLKKKLKFTLISKPLKEYSDHSSDNPHRKANFDVELAVDASLSHEDYDTMVLFSGDCDFEYLLKRLRGINKNTIVFSRAGHIAKELPPACNEYFDIIDFRHEILSIKKAPDAKNPLRGNGEDPAVNVR